MVEGSSGRQSNDLASILDEQEVGNIEERERASARWKKKK
jgi:hypothetical protein